MKEELQECKEVEQQIKRMVLSILQPAEVKWAPTRETCQCKNSPVRVVARATMRQQQEGVKDNICACEVYKFKLQCSTIYFPL